jgi:hypothetical protein
VLPPGATNETVTHAPAKRKTGERIALSVQPESV